ncbi:MAG TPA: aldo/keto reductase [Actinomycetota bacterium]|jgi:aryl-alcohol dehydrogenase-like predicted oxidoreductase|nr:aldo/keto reductase [Actinomycetota bacterium]
MERRRLGPDGPEVGEIGLGCMSMSWAYYGGGSEDESIRVIHRALELGITLFDTADVYGPFTNEELVGRALQGRRGDAVIATKVGVRVGPNGGYPLLRDARPERILQEVEGSLRRLRTDAIDLYYLHRVDPEVPLEEQWGAMASLVQAGKVRSIGLSEPTLDELERAQAIHRVAAVQSELSLWTRDPLDDVVPWCREHGAAFVPFAPLGRGFLTGTVTEAAFDPMDFRATNPRFTREQIRANRGIVDIVRGVAERHDATPAQVAIAWVLTRGDHVIPIPGTKRLRYLEENVAAAGLRLDPADLAELDVLPAPTASRY